MLICLKPAWEERKKKAADIYRTNGILFPHYELEVRETIFYEKGLTIPTLILSAGWSSTSILDIELIYSPYAKVVFSAAV